jgi:hypothetical protein
VQGPPSGAARIDDRGRSPHISTRWIVSPPLLLTIDRFLMNCTHAWPSPIVPGPCRKMPIFLGPALEKVHSPREGTRPGLYFFFSLLTYWHPQFYSHQFFQNCYLRTQKLIPNHLSIHLALLITIFFLSRIPSFMHLLSFIQSSRAPVGIISTSSPGESIAIGPAPCNWRLGSRSCSHHDGTRCGRRGAWDTLDEG